MTDISLALGGGGSKGYAHLGVIRALLEMGFEITAIAGTSAGGMAGAIYAAGYSPEQVLDRISSVSQEDLFGFGRGPALLSTDGIHQVLEGFLGGLNFSDLKIPLALTAVDLDEMKEVVIRQGSVLDAVMATIAIPGVFPPKELGNRILVDGMVLHAVPVSTARQISPRKPVIAVSLTPEPEHWQVSYPWDSKPANPLLRPISRLRIARAFDIYLRSMDITLHMLGELRLELEEPEVVIRPKVANIGSLDRVDVREVARLGDQAVQEARKPLKRLKRRSRRKKTSRDR
ncbi:MAG: patatin-like phospholipase family protein [Anaerolineales bacterium]